MKIAVLGGGNGSNAAVADMLEAGHDVIWWRRSANSFSEIEKAGGLSVIDYKGTRLVTPVMK